AHRAAGIFRPARNGGGLSEAAVECVPRRGGGPPARTRGKRRPPSTGSERSTGMDLGGSAGRPPGGKRPGRTEISAGLFSNNSGPTRGWVSMVVVDRGRLERGSPNPLDSPPTAVRIREAIRCFVLKTGSPHGSVSFVLCNTKRQRLPACSRARKPARVLSQGV